MSTSLKLAKITEKYQILVENYPESIRKCSSFLFGPTTVFKKDPHYRCFSASLFQSSTVKPRFDKQNRRILCVRVKIAK